MTSASAVRRCFVLILAALGFLSALRASPVSPDERSIRRDIKKLESALQAPDPTAWVYCYTEDAVFVGPGEQPVQGRAALLEMAKSMTPLRSLKIVPQRIESSGPLAYAYIRGQWSSGKAGAEHPTYARSLLILRRESDGQWRVAHEFMGMDPDTSPAAESGQQ